MGFNSEFKGLISRSQGRRGGGLHIQVMDLGLLILTERICGLPSLDQKVECTFVLVHEYIVTASCGAGIATFFSEIDIRWR